MTAVIEAFCQPGCSFLVPPFGTPLAPDSVVDISHESLMRVWERLNAWLDEEAESGQRYRRLAETAVLYHAGQEDVLRNPGLQLALDWHEENSPHEAWAQRSHPDFDATKRFLEDSIRARETERARQAEEAQRQREAEEVGRQREAEEVQRQREFESARAIAEERAKRLAEQERAAKRLRRGMIGFAVVSVMVIGVAVFAYFQRHAAQAERDKAQVAEAEALQQKS